MNIPEDDFLAEDVIPQKRVALNSREKKLIVNMGLEILKFGLLLLIGAIFVFGLMHVMQFWPWRPIIQNYFSSEIQQFIASEQEKWGFNESIFTQFFLYLRNILQGDFGYSFVVKRDVAVNVLIADRWPKSVQLLLVSLLFAIIPSLVLGIIAANRKGRWADRIILAVAGVCFILSLSWIGMVFQYLFAIKLDVFDATSFQSPEYITYDPNLTGYVLIDSLIKGDGEVFLDVFKHLIMPCTVISSSFIAMGILIVRRLVIIYKTKKLNLPKRNYLRVSLAFFIMSLVLIQTESIFRLNGIFTLALLAIQGRDFFLIMGSLLKLFFIFQLLVLTIDMGGILVQYWLDRKNPVPDNAEEIGLTSLPKPKLGTGGETNYSEEILSPSSHSNGIGQKLQVKSILLRPGVIMGLVLLLGCLILLFFGFYSYDLYSLTIDTSSQTWEPPSSDHPWGTARYGRDVLGRTLYGFAFPLLHLLPFVLVVTIIGMVIGLFLSFKNRAVDNCFDFIERFAMLFPLIFIQILFITKYDQRIPIIIILLCLNAFGFSLLFGRRILSKEDRKLFVRGSKTSYLIHAIPQMLTGAFLISILTVFALNTLAYLGYTPNEVILWGNDMDYARSHLYNAPWAYFFPIGASFLLGLSLILITASLYGYVSKQNQMPTNDLIPT